MLTNLNKYQGTTTDERKFRLYDLERGVEADKGRLYTVEEMQDMKDKEFSAILNDDLVESFIDETGTFIAPGAPESVYMSGTDLPRFAFMPDGDKYQNYFNGMISMMAAGFDPATVKQQYGSGNFKNVIEKINSGEVKLGTSLRISGFGRYLVDGLTAPSELSSDEVSAQLDIKKLGLTPASIAPYAGEIVRRISRGESFEDLVKSKTIKPELADVFSSYYNAAAPEQGGAFDLAKVVRPQYLGRLEKQLTDKGISSFEQNLINLNNAQNLFASDGNVTTPPYTSNLTSSGFPIGDGRRDLTIQEIAALKKGSSIAGDNSTVFTNEAGAPVYIEAENKDIERAVNYALRFAPQSTFADRSAATTAPFSADAVVGIAASYLPDEAFYTLPDGAKGYLRPEYAEQIQQVLTTLSKADVGASAEQYSDALKNYNKELGNFYERQQKGMDDFGEAAMEYYGPDTQFDYEYDKSMPYGRPFDFRGMPAEGTMDEIFQNPFNTEFLKDEDGYSKLYRQMHLRGRHNYRPAPLEWYGLKESVAKYLPDAVVNYVNNPNNLLGAKAIRRGYDNMLVGSPFAFRMNEDYAARRPFQAGLGTGLYYAGAVPTEFALRGISGGLQFADNYLDFLPTGYKENLKNISNSPVLGVTYKNPSDGPYRNFDNTPNLLGINTSMSNLGQEQMPEPEEIYEQGLMNRYNTFDNFFGTRAPVGYNKFLTGELIMEGDPDYVDRAGHAVIPTDLMFTRGFQDKLADMGPGYSIGANILGNMLFGRAMRLPGNIARGVTKTGTKYTVGPKGGITAQNQYSFRQPFDLLRGRGVKGYSFTDPLTGSVFGESVIGQGFGKPSFYGAQFGTNAPVATNMLSQNIGSKPGFTPSVTFTGTLGRQGLNPTGLYKGQAFNQNMRFNTGYMDLFRGQTFKPSISSKLPQVNP